MGAVPRQGRAGGGGGGMGGVATPTEVARGSGEAEEGCLLTEGPQ